MPVEYRGDWNDDILAALAHLHQAVLPFQGWNAASLKSTLDSPNSHMQIAYSESEPVGFILYRDNGEGIELLTVAVSPDHQRKGIGRSLLRLMLAAFPTQDCILEVATDNVAAQQLYLQFGYETIHTRKGYYYRGSRPACDAAVMKRKAAPLPLI